jgi:hypothetical protein
LLTAVNIAPSLVAMTLPSHGSHLGEVMADYNHMVTGDCLIEDTSTRRVPEMIAARQEPSPGPPD